MNFDTAIEEFRRYLRLNNRSKNTIDCYIETITNTLKGKDLDNLTQRDLEDIILGYIEKNRSKNTIRLRQAILNVFCRAILHRDDLGFEIPKQERIHKNPFTPEETQQMLEAAKKKSKRDYAMVLLLLDGALRRSETSNLNLDDVKFGTSEIYLRDSKTGNDIIYMTSRVADAIKDYLLYERRPKDVKDQALFISKRGTRIKEHFVRNHLKAIAVEAGITSRVHPHRFRTTSITHLLNNKVNPIIVQKQARHGTLKQTMDYDRPTQQDSKTALEEVFVAKKDLDNDERIKATVDKYVHGEITKDELQTILDALRPKSLKYDGELRGYQ